jgi:GntR family transcriptional regulator
MLTIDPRDAAPLWRQIEDGVRRMVAAGVLAPGGPLPSVRELARELTVNPATVVRAYQRLCEEGVLTVRRGEGTFVAAVPPRLPEARRRELLEQGARRYAALATTLGADSPEAVEVVERALRLLAAESATTTEESA